MKAFRKVELHTSQQSGPQGLRRPRFSFFRFTCQTARNHDDSTLRHAGEPSKLHASDQDRKLGHRISVRCFAGATSRRKADGAPYGVYIVLRRVGCPHLKPGGAPPQPRTANPQNTPLRLPPAPRSTPASTRPSCARGGASPTTSN